jgi:exonuclease SbcD
MKFLHTSDWHVGKTLKGRSRLDEQEAVLREIVGVANEHDVEAVLVAGDLYDSSAPSAEAQRLVVKALAGLAQRDRVVIAIAGNHDHPLAFDAYRPVMQAAGITMIGRVRTEQQGGVVRFDARDTGEPVAVAALPFLSQRYAVRAAELVTGSAAENSGTYDQHVRDVIRQLTSAFTPDSVNLVLTHVTVTGGKLGGGERAAQTIFEYYVPAAAFPADAHYVALGHLHRRQDIAAPCRVVYSGSPLAVDFGEQDNTQVVCVVEAHPGTPANVADVPITSGRRLRTVHGTVDELLARAEDLQGDYLRVLVQEKARAGLREQLQAALPDALEIRIDPKFAAAVNDGVGGRDHAGRTPGELFAAYLAEAQVDDPRVGKLFDQLHDELFQSEGR